LSLRTRRRSAAALAAALLRPCAPAVAAAPSLAAVVADARAEGGRLADARALARALLPRPLPVQVLKVRMDGIGAHEVAGLVLSGVKFHGRVTRAAFDRETADLIARTFAASRAEEVDVTAVVPIAYARGTIVSGDLARPTVRTVFTVTVRRTEASAVPARLARGDGVFRDAGWTAELAPGR